MREIEFRGKRQRDNSWIYGLLTNDTYGHYRIQFDTNQFSQVVIPETVGQLWATINNNKYFEGDIVSVGLFTNVTYVIIYNDIKKCVSFIKISEYKKLKRGDELSRLKILYNLGSAKFELMQKYNPTLLGNIFDNPDLLK